METTLKLSEEQAAAFDVEYVSAARWERIKSCIDGSFNGHFTFIDVGGGNGKFADRLLAHYPNAHGTVIDTSELLLAKNTPNDRKRVINANALALGSFGSYDIVFCNWLLHHLVGSSYAQSRENINTMLSAACKALTPDGKLSIFENDCTGLIDGISSRLIYEATSSKALAFLTKRLGANTAGVGVCYLSHRQWLESLQNAGTELISSVSEPRHLSPTKRLGLLVREIRTTHYWAHRAP